MTSTWKPTMRCGTAFPMPCNQDSADVRQRRWGPGGTQPTTDADGNRLQETSVVVAEASTPHTKETLLQVKQSLGQRKTHEEPSYCLRAMYIPPEEVEHVAKLGPDPELLGASWPDEKFAKNRSRASTCSTSDTSYVSSDEAESTSIPELSEFKLDAPMYVDMMTVYPEVFESFDGEHSYCNAAAMVDQESSFDAFATGFVPQDVCDILAEYAYMQIGEASIQTIFADEQEWMDFSNSEQSFYDETVSFDETITWHGTQSLVPDLVSNEGTFNTNAKEFMPCVCSGYVVRPPPGLEL